MISLMGDKMGDKKAEPQGVRLCEGFSSDISEPRQVEYSKERREKQ